MAIVNPLYRDPSGEIKEAQPGDLINLPFVDVDQFIDLTLFIDHITLFQDAPVNTCCTILNATAIPVNSINTPQVSYHPKPIVDCVILEGGIAGQSVLAAIAYGKIYRTPEVITYTNSLTLYLGRNGKLTTIVPTLAAGDKYQVEVGRLVNNTTFIFAPKPAINLRQTDPIPGGDLPSPVGHNGEALFSDGSEYILRKISQSDLLQAFAYTIISTPQLTYEIGEPLVHPVFSLIYNKEISHIEAKDTDHINYQPVTLTNNLYTSPYSYISYTESSKVFTFLATSTSGEQVESSIELKWRYKKYYGSTSVINDMTLFEDQFNINTSGSVYVAIPVNYTRQQISCENLVGGFVLDSVVTHINEFGYDIDYNIYKSENSNLGNLIVDIV